MEKFKYTREELRALAIVANAEMRKISYIFEEAFDKMCKQSAEDETQKLLDSLK